MYAATASSARSRRSIARGPGADDLHQQRLRLVRVARQRPQERAQRGAHARRRVGVDVLRRRLAHVAQEGLGRRVEQRDDAVLLVAEVLVERGLRHPGLAGDRLGGRVGVSAAGEHHRRGREQAGALAVLPDLQRRGVAPPRHRGTFLHGPDGNRATRITPPMKRFALAVLARADPRRVHPGRALVRRQVHRRRGPGGRRRSRISRRRASETSPRTSARRSSPRSSSTSSRRAARTARRRCRRRSRTPTTSTSRCSR